MLGTTGGETVNGTNGNDVICNDTIYGGNGNDSIDAGPGNDTVDGGIGNDTCANTEHPASYT